MHQPWCGRGSHRFRLGLKYDRIPVATLTNAAAAALDDGERAAIALAVAIGAELILMDDRAGVAVAYQKGLTVTGTLGVLDLAARRGLIRTFPQSKLKSLYFLDCLIED
jgi:predicted nucleic acid-binding protein